MRFAFIIVLIFCSSMLKAQDKTLYDSSSVEVKNFAPSSLDAYRKNKEFQYDSQVTETESVWSRVWKWFWKEYDEIMSTKAGRITMNILFWVLGIGAVAFFVFKVIKMNRLSMFAEDAKALTAYKIETEDIHTISFEDAIEEALKSSNYRIAIRLLYLQNLKTLTDKELIIWLPNKTNADYLREINGTALQKNFKSLTNIFEYAWYGSRMILKEDYDTMKEQFTIFQNQL